MLGTTSVEAKCQPNRTNDGMTYLMGWYRPATPAYGVEAGIENYSPWVQPGIDDSVASSAWSMLEAPNRWAQIGWLEYPYDERHTFIQYRNTDNIPVVEDYPPFALGSLTVYTVTYDGSNFRFYAGGSLYKTAPATFSPSRATVSGEIHTLATQMPGGYSADVWLASSLYETQPNGVWNELNGFVTNSDTAEFGYHYYSTNMIGIFDKRCAS